MDSRTSTGTQLNLVSATMPRDLQRNIGALISVRLYLCDRYCGIIIVPGGSMFMDLVGTSYTYPQIYLPTKFLKTYESS